MWTGYQFSALTAGCCTNLNFDQGEFYDHSCMLEDSFRCYSLTTLSTLTFNNSLQTSIIWDLWHSMFYAFKPICWCTGCCKLHFVYNRLLEWKWRASHLPKMKCNTKEESNIRSTGRSGTAKLVIFKTYIFLPLEIPSACKCRSYQQLQLSQRNWHMLRKLNITMRHWGLVWTGAREVPGMSIGCTHNLFLCGTAHKPSMGLQNT